MKPNTKFDWTWLAALLPALLGVLIVVVLAELDVIEFNFSIHDLDTFLVLIGLLITIVLSSILISREAVRRMQQFSLSQARKESLAEHTRFLRRLDHELKNPLMGIRAALVNLADTDDAEVRQQIRASIDTQVMRLTRLVLDLRKVAEIEMQPIEQIPVALDALLREALMLALDEIEPASRQVDIDIPPELPALNGDPDLLLAAFFNLISNAVKYSQMGDSIRVSVHVEPNSIVVEIEDSGIGIAPDDMPYVWDELFRAERAKAFAGSGIGLALVKRIIERHGGTVQLRSELERGTTVTVHLPTLTAAQ